MRPLDPSEPRMVGRYRLVGVLGEGGMGRVLLGVGPDGRLVAVKQVHAELVRDDDFRARFRQEVDASRRVAGAYTAAVLDADPDETTPWLASVYVAGPSLQEVVDTAGPLPVAVIRLLAAGLAAALRDIHRAGIVHRDLKPSNVLLTEDGLRVIDFGIARATMADGRLTRSGMVIGSPGFMSPEQVSGEAITPSSDMFAVGALLVTMATGRCPFLGASTPETLYKVVHTEADLAGVLPELRPLAAACLAKHPAARPTPEQVLDWLGPVPVDITAWPPVVQQLISARRQATHTALFASPPTPAAPAEPRARVRHRGRVLAGAVLATVLLAAGVVVTMRLNDGAGTATVGGGDAETKDSRPRAVTVSYLRQFEPCRVLDGQQVEGIGELNALAQAPDIRRCDYTSESGESLTLDLGHAVLPDSIRPTTRIRGLETRFHRLNGKCVASAVFPDQPELAVQASTATRDQERGMDGCAVADDALRSTIERVERGIGKREPEPGSLRTVDACGVLDDATISRILGHTASVSVDNIHNCGWGPGRGDPVVTVHFLLGSLPHKSDTQLRMVDVGGVEVYQETERGESQVPLCELGWYRDVGEGNRSEKVAVYYHSPDGPVPVEELCGRGRDVIAGLLPNLPAE